MDRCNKYQTKQYNHPHTTRTLDGGQYLAGWPLRKTIRSSESMRKGMEIWSVNKSIKITITIIRRLRYDRHQSREIRRIVIVSTIKLRHLFLMLISVLVSTTSPSVFPGGYILQRVQNSLTRIVFMGGASGSRGQLPPSVALALPLPPSCPSPPSSPPPQLSSMHSSRALPWLISAPTCPVFCPPPPMTVLRLIAYMAHSDPFRSQPHWLPVHRRTRYISDSSKKTMTWAQIIMLNCNVYIHQPRPPNRNWCGGNML